MGILSFKRVDDFTIFRAKGASFWEYEVLLFRFLDSFINFHPLIVSSSSVTPVVTTSLFIFPNFPKTFSMMEFGETSECKIKSLFGVFLKRLLLHFFALSCSVNAFILIKLVYFNIHDFSRCLRVFKLIWRSFIFMLVSGSIVWSIIGAMIRMVMVMSLANRNLNSLKMWIYLHYLRYKSLKLSTRTPVGNVSYLIRD